MPSSFAGSAPSAAEAPGRPVLGLVHDALSRGRRCGTVPLGHGADHAGDRPPRSRGARADPPAERVRTGGFPAEVTYGTDPWERHA
ncbi:hypothetical protein GCM10019016_029790 [Streptomyces prasinosporus]|uniref:Uncharacterized protein n=1 Tax=Streptomyces prasinosporus TaxID=68256 RepID=A0ABP6TM79_9ACTN